MKNDRNVSNSDLQELALLGYKGSTVIEDLMIPLNEKFVQAGQYRWDDKAWWMHLKDKTKNKGKGFPDIVFKELKIWLQTQ